LQMSSITISHILQSPCIAHGLMLIFNFSKVSDSVVSRSVVPMQE
jgi:hypothetical protein